MRCSLGCYGDPVAKTPHLDRLAAEGVVFRRAYVQQAVCSASRASFLTGCRPETTTVDYPYNDHFRDTFLPGHPSLPLYFQQQGYEAATGGKIHHELTDLAKLKTKMFPKGVTYALPENASHEKKGFGGGKRPAYESADAPDVTYKDGQLAADAVKWLEGHVRRGAGQPFFLAVGFVRPHLPLTAPKKNWDLHDPEQLRLSADLGARPDKAPAWAMNPGGELFVGYLKEDHPTTPDKALKLRHGYYAAMSYADACVGTVIDALDRLGLRKNTLIVFWSDHGYHLGENGSWTKHTNFEWATHAPLIVAGPGVSRGEVCDALVEYVDLFPTICELTGTAAPDYLEGASLKPLLENVKAPWKNEARSQWPKLEKGMEGFSLRTDRWRFTDWRKRTGDEDDQPSAIGDRVAVELYDHQNDPGETRNVAAENPDVVAELSARLWADGEPG